MLISHHPLHRNQSKKSIMNSFPGSFFSNIPPPSYPSDFVMTREMFNSFHKIDRALFARLVFTLKRDINQSYQVMGFILLLEHASYAKDLVVYLGSLQDTFIDALANEIGVCLSFLYHQEFASTFFAANNNDENTVIPLLIRLTGGKLSLRLIHQNRETFRHGLTKTMNDVCARAFEDIILRAETYNKEKLLAMEKEILAKEMRQLGFEEDSTFTFPIQQETVPPPTRLSPVQEEVKKEEQEAEMAADDRTVFLTFSKGYPISEEEVRVYFTRRFGEVIEAIEMQEGNGQPLFAKMVLKMRYASKMGDVVNARSRNKYTINGKHVWARKYIRRNPYFPAGSSSIDGKHA